MNAKRKVELLAPAGKWSVLSEVVAAGADAVYLGGKRFNMRLLRPDFNFSDQELRDAVSLCHDQGVKLYVTVNNLYYQRELPELFEYLAFLKDIGVDAVIIQDLALIEPCRGLGLPLHASVQMGINHLDSVRILEQSGFSRVILSKNLSLTEIREINQHSTIGLEYFVHGDLCVAHTGQCLMSGLLCGESGNRGRCRKPCRWVYDLIAEKSGVMAESQYLLAHKDLCLYLSIPELIEAGIISFKIEGRMREPEYLSLLVTSYRHALDRYMDAGLDPSRDDREWNELFTHRVREFTSGNLCGAVGADNLGLTGEREPLFPTTPVKIDRLTPKDYVVWEEIRPREVRLSVKAGGQAGLETAIAKGVGTIVVPATLFRQAGRFESLDDIRAAVRSGREAGVRMVLEMPRIIAEKDRDVAEKLWCLAEDAQAVLVHDPGSLFRAAQAGIEAWAGQGFNLSNSLAVEQLRSWGAVRACPSVELGRRDFSEMAPNSPLPLEVVVQGSVCGMISDICVVGAVRGCQREVCAFPEEACCLVDRLGQKYPVETDCECRSHIYHPLEMTLFHLLPWLSQRVDSVRIDGDRYSPELLGEVIAIYQSALKDITTGVWKQVSNFHRLIDLFPEGLACGNVGWPESIG